APTRRIRGIVDGSELDARCKEVGTAEGPCLLINVQAIPVTAGPYRRDRPSYPQGTLGRLVAQVLVGSLLLELAHEVGVRHENHQRARKIAVTIYRSRAGWNATSAMRAGPWVILTREKTAPSRVAPSMATSAARTCAASDW